MKKSVLRGDELCHRQAKRHKVSLNRELINQSSHHSFYTDSTTPGWKNESFEDKLLQLRTVAIDPSNPKSSFGSVQQSWTLTVRKVLFLNSSFLPWKRRKVHFVQESSTITCDLNKVESNEQSSIGPSRQGSFGSSTPCIINSADSIESYSRRMVHNSSCSLSLLKFEIYIPRNQVLVEHSFQDDGTNWGNPPNKDASLIDSDDSVSDSNPSSPWQSTEKTQKSAKITKFVDNIPSSCQSVLQDLTSPSNKDASVLLDSADSLSGSNKSSYEQQLLNFIGDNVPKLVIPVGPPFQADLPEWIGPPNKNLYNGDSSLNNSSWLGTRVWPIEDKIIESDELIGKGRSNTCFCTSPGSTDCIKCHINEERLRLQSELGPAFFTWRFDCMGEEVSRSWSFNDQRSFESLVKTNPPSRGKSFWKPALKRFQSKCKKSIVSYYFNVFILRRMSMQTRLVPEMADSDDDEADEVLYSKKSRKNGSFKLRRRNDVKNRYLTGIR
ncbi:PREDICTED: uncharacterized protein LOC104597002 [Nelumbo nucifera]|uniref:Uncharacterized protein LOC104597002 n=2 Tax=Nelumbo nucifera TaxID=4432 RepID=A0A1U8Q378_NELNU|nr:PREDICTED: uncharacterized protein LOC104597002 [Nelumbo nucifera]XP_010256666.1 PREDICTED: uncharacterized protein LOC104597002 [Nelumbo nucifera]XP_010256667.1 PREDICTED: uncharacterized protein LOC104597002 [Nelumbo nucifera]XP_010256668.1 PREDICTED: uncharacterized protein LOC104597002 [Nelumbo nucifera]XP_019053258.1 PREDICTED: uncharacterized protein LOC104597002 [Nelumbo nucifera]DAD26633.1 TPA_asm: hypothetical protein HUJ06_028101 [Nelumbo nucifera]